MWKALWKLFFPEYHKAKYFRTVRVAFPLVIVTALIAGFANVISENASFVTIEAKTPIVQRDQVFFIDVSVTAHVPINAIDLTIDYPENKIVIDNIDVGTSVITLWTKEPYAENGNIYLSGGTFRKGFIGEHTIARIKAHATESGEARLSIKDTELIAGDGQGTQIDSVEDKEKSIARIYVSGEDGLISGKVEITFVTDIDGDGKIDLKDISAFMAAWFTKSKIYDFDGDGRMTFKDFSIILADSFLR